MADILKVKRGAKAKLPQLRYGEPAFVSDEEELYIGGVHGNVKVTHKQEMDALVSQMEESMNNAIGVSVKNFGAKCDGITDDTEAIKRALTSNEKIITMNCDCKISSSLVLPIDKAYIFNGSFIIDDSFVGNNIISISDLNTAMNINKISIIHSKFYKQDRHNVVNNVRTNFDGIVINNCRRLTIKEIEVIGITTRAMVVNGGYETHIDKADIWGSNIDDSISITSAVDKLDFTNQGEKYTIGIVVNGNDSFYNNITCVGFNIGMSVNSCNAITNFHPWAYKSSMVYGLVTKGSYNMCNNLYLDTIKSVGGRSGAGIYECKKVDTTSVTAIERNKYSNITSLAVDENSYVAELGDNENAQSSYMTSIVNIVGEYGSNLYKLNGTAKGNPLLDNKIGVTSKDYWVSSSKLVFNRNSAINDIIKEIILNHMETNFNGFKNSISFIDKNKEITCKLPNTSALSNQIAIISVEGCSSNYYRCSIRGTGYPNSETYIIDVCRNDSNVYDFYHVLHSPTKAYSWFPSAADFSVGTMLFYKNKPIWKSSNGYWVDATGAQVYA